MTQAIKSIIDYLWAIFDKVNEKLTFELFGQNVSYFSLILAVIVLVMLLSIFWKGVRG